MCRNVKIPKDQEECRKALRGLIYNLGLEGKISNPPLNGLRDLDARTEELFQVVQAGISHNATHGSIPCTFGGTELLFILAT